MKLTAYDLAPNKQEYLSQFFIDCETAQVSPSSWHAKALSLAKTNTAQQIADACGVKKAAVQALMRRRGVKAVNERRSVADAKIYAKLNKRGYTRSQISERMDCEPSRVDTLKRVARELGYL